MNNKCNHENIKPIIERDDNENLVVFAVVCLDCLSEFPVSPMTLSEYNRSVKN